MELVASIAICAALVIWAGSRLSMTVIQLTNSLSILKGCAGIFLILLITSLPEFFTTISSVSSLHSADMAFGNVLGSCAFNLVMLAFMDLFFVKGNKSAFNRVSSTQVISFSLATIMLAFAGGMVVLQSDYLFGFKGTQLILIGSLFILITRIINYKKVEKETDSNAHNSEGPASSGALISKFIFYTTITMVTAWLLPKYIMEMGLLTGLGNTFTSTFILAIIASLPKISIALVFIKFGFIDRAFDNLLNTNLLHLVLLGLSDLFYSGGNLFSTASHDHVISITAVLLMTFFTVMSMIRKPVRKKSNLTIEIFMNIITYYSFMAILYRVAR
jgi:cation:H+ antiporter